RRADALPSTSFVCRTRRSHGNRTRGRSSLNHREGTSIVATIRDIANQINNTLTQINLDTQDTANTLGLVKGDTADIKSRMDTLIGVNQAGFEQLGQGMFLMLEQLRLANSLLAGQVRQQDAMLCWFANLADLLCRILQRENSQLELQTRIHRKSAV